MYKKILFDLSYLSKKTERIQMSVSEINHIGFLSKDVRLVALNTIQQRLIVTAHICELELSLNYKLVSPINDFIWSKEEMSMQLQRYLKRTLVIDTCFAIDNMLTHLLDKTGKKVTSSVSTNYRNYIDMLSCSTDDKTHHTNVIKVLSYLRNTSHNNGVHNRKSFEYAIQNQKFVFKINKVQYNYSWEMIKTIIDESLNSLELILTTNFINSDYDLKKMIPDSFNEQTT